MVGDSLIADIGGAKQLNMKTIWLNSNNDKNTTEFFHDFEIKTINELIGLTCQ
jgi:FMN phosphatase YigB (HAD superfamily)